MAAVTNGEIKRLLMNVPPGCMKSLTTSVFWPSWEWIEQPELRYVGTSHKLDLALRDNIKMRRLIESEWYQDRFPLKFRDDQNTKTKYENDKTGAREATPFKKMTGIRGDRVILDDPISADDANSEAELLQTEVAFTETLPTRINNDQSAIVVIMQRLHQNDTSGLILEKGLDYTHLMLPMEFEEERRCRTQINFVDPREEDGELLFPERFGPVQVQELKDTMGSYAVAGQFQQRPTSREGGLFKRSWFDDQYIDLKDIPAGTVWIRHWDLAATDRKKNKRAARTSGVKMGRTPDGRYIVAHVATEMKEGDEVRKTVKSIAKMDGKRVKISLPQDPGQAGKVQAKDYIKMLAGWTAHAEPETGDKFTRAEPFAAQCEASNVYLVRGSWNADYIDELCQFPGANLKDQVDASSGAFTQLTMGEFITPMTEVL